MRFILGLIVGVVLTVGGAYFHDANLAPAPLGSPGGGQIVNWDVVDSLAGDQVAFVKGLWNQAFGG